jgi:hypothetical protein
MKVVKLVPRKLTPVQERSSFITMRLNQGATYQSAIREYDSKKKEANGRTR